MTRPRPGRYPVSSFGPELMELLIQGSTREVRVPCESMKQMKFLQMRIQTLRGAMAKEKHPQYAIATRARVSCTWDFEHFPSTKNQRFPPHAKGCVLIIRPQDSQFTSILAAAGIEVSKAATDVLRDDLLPSTPSDPSLQPSEPPADDSTDAPSSPYERFK